LAAPERSIFLSRRPNEASLIRVPLRPCGLMLRANANSQESVVTPRDGGLRSVHCSLTLRPDKQH
jgi:hypothetical protein